MRRSVSLACLILLCGCAYSGLFKDPFVDIPNFYRVDDILYRGGQPTYDGLEKLKSLGIKTIISLRGENQELIEEERMTLELGINLYNVPMSIYRRPTDEEALKLLEIILLEDNQPVFIHCENGRDRTGTIVAMYQVIVKGLTPKEAYREAKKYGFWPYRGEAQLKKFILQLKDKKIYFEKVKEFTYGKN